MTEKTKVVPEGIKTIYVNWSVLGENVSHNDRP